VRATDPTAAGAARVAAGRESVGEPTEPA
jgi:hypothetical protein